MDAMNALLTRRSIRKYKDGEISDEDLKAILKAGMYAPAAGGSRPWEFIVIRDREKLEELSGVRPYWHMLKNAQAAICVLINIEGYRASTPEFAPEDVSACTENILLAAHACGYGAVWLGLHPVPAAVESVRSLLEIPPEIVPFSMISVGIPDEIKPDPLRYDETKIHYEKY